MIIPKMKPSRSAQSEYAIEEITEGIIFIRDLNLAGRMSVTNDAERVLDDLEIEYGPLRVVYRDSLGEYCEIAWSPNSRSADRTVVFIPWNGLAWDILKR